MPELPEVETVVRDLRGELTGRRVESVTLGHTSVIRFPVPEVFRQTLVGRTVTSVVRRGKYILCRLDNDEELIVHLGMTGHLLMVDAQSATPRHTHLRATLDDGRELRFDDVRRFGRLMLGPREVLERVGVLPRLGVEPLSEEFTVEQLRSWLVNTNRVLKSALLDQSRIAGLGNIYVDEACHLAGIRPTRRARRLTRGQSIALHDAIGVVLRSAIHNRGTSFDDYRDVWNAKGKNQERLQVYGRGGLPCYRCGRLLRRTTVAGRTTVFCQSCQL